MDPPKVSEQGRTADLSGIPSGRGTGTRCAELATRVSEAERIAWQAQRKRECEEAERARPAKTFVDARKDRFSAIDVWDTAERIRAYFAAAQSAILAMHEVDRLVMTNSLDKADGRRFGSIDAAAASCASH